MRLQTIVVVGNGKTSRANVEAILGDAFLVNKEVKINFVARTTQSEGLTWAQQYTASQGIIGTVYGSESSLSFNQVLEDNSGRQIEFYILWDDEDFDCLEAIKFCQENGIPAFDLTNGLVPIKTKGTFTTPTLLDMPEVERVVSNKTDLKKVVIEEYDDDEEEDEEEDDEEELDSETIVLEGIQEIARIFAMAIAAELKELLKPEGKNDSE